MKECPWCGGQYSRGYEVAKRNKTRRSDPSSFCSVECWWAADYKNAIGLTAMLLSIAIIFSILYFAFPSYFQGRFAFETIFLVVVGFGCGLPSLWPIRRSREIRREVPQDSRRGQRVDEPLSEHRDY